MYIIIIAPYKNYLQINLQEQESLSLLRYMEQISEV